MPNRPCIAFLIAAASAGTASAQLAQPGRLSTTDVPVAKVVLFSSGVGYFEHAGSVRGNATTELRFKTSQINDILKSIVLQDQDGGRVGAITYPSQDPLAKTLKSFQVDITQNPGLAQLLNQLRGAKVRVQSQAETLSGTILGVESRAKPADRGERVDVSVLNLLAGASIRSVELPSITSLTLDDPQLEEELTKALSALVQARDQDKKPVTIDFAGSGDRRVRIGYVVEQPIWKTSYRLLLDEKGRYGKLQGWAIVENQTESDWSNVSLSLVSGRPMSFMMDLYQPLYATRPTVVSELYAGLHPQVYDGGMEENRERVPMRSDMPKSQSAGDARDVAADALATRRAGFGPEGRPAVSRLGEVVTTGAIGPIDASRSIQAIAQAGKLGELFQYTVGNVTLARQKSAMLPIITDSVELERLSIFNESVLRPNPLNGVRLKNTSGKHLLQGPVTVFDNGGYAGDARIDNVPPGQERFLSYGIDLEMTVDDTKNTASSSVVTAKIVKGILTLQRKQVASQEYAADNKSSQEKTLVIERAVHPGWKLVGANKPFETTPAVYRFKSVIPPGKVSVLAVTEEIVRDESLALLSTDIGQLLGYNRTGEIPAAVRDALSKAIQLKQALAGVESDIAARVQRIADITQEQNRIRENMRTVASSTQYYERLLVKLNEQESAIEKLQQERTTLSAKRDTLRSDLENYLNTLTIA